MIHYGVTYEMRALPAPTRPYMAFPFPPAGKACRLPFLESNATAVVTLQIGRFEVESVFLSVIRLHLFARQS